MVVVWQCCAQAVLRPLRFTRALNRKTVRIIDPNHEREYLDEILHRPYDIEDKNKRVRLDRERRQEPSRNARSRGTSARDFDYEPVPS